MISVLRTALGGGNYSAVGVRERTKTNNHGDAELSYLQAYKDCGVGGGIRATGIFVSRTHSRKVATARQRQQVRTKTTALQSRGAADERSKTNSHDDADAYSNDYSNFTNKDNVLGGGNRSTGFFVLRMHPSDLEAGIWQDQLQDFVDGQLEANRGRRRGP